MPSLASLRDPDASCVRATPGEPIAELPTVTRLPGSSLHSVGLTTHRVVRPTRLEATRTPCQSAKGDGPVATALTKVELNDPVTRHLHQDFARMLVSQTVGQALD